MGRGALRKRSSSDGIWGIMAESFFWKGEMETRERD